MIFASFFFFFLAFYFGKTNFNGREFGQKQMKEPDNIFFIARLREFLLLQNLQFMHAYKKKKKIETEIKIKIKIKDKSS
jgi:hypothetical protein